MNNGAANVAALTAAIKDAGDVSSSLPSGGFARRHTVSKGSPGRTAQTSLLTSRLMADRNGEIPENAIDDDPADTSDQAASAAQKARVRRASDGQPLTKEGRKSNRAELRCKKCGKGYKHSSCLTKHLWEHTPEWSYTSKLLISKHQQVQLLEAASVLVAMNNTPKDEPVPAIVNVSTPPDSVRGFPSDNESASPTASGYSELNDRQSSADTTPPPQQEMFGQSIPGYHHLSKRYSSGGFSRSYQSTPISGIVGSAPNGPFGGFGHARQQSQDRRPPSSGMNATGQEDRDLAAAVELLSCSFGSNSGGRTVTLPPDAPPVPPLPAQYLDQAASLSSAGFINSFPSRQPESFTRGELRNVDVKMEDSADSDVPEDDEDMQSRARSDEDDDGVFGRMVI